MAVVRALTFVDSSSRIRDPLIFGWSAGRLVWVAGVTK